MADQKYELLIVIRTELQFEGTLAKIRSELGKLDQAGAQVLGAQSKTAQGAKALTGVQDVLAQATTAAGASMQKEGQRTAELADVLRVLSTAARGGAEAKRAFNSVSAALPDTVLKEIAASKTFVDVQEKLARALGVTGQSTEIFQAASRAVPGELAQTTAALRISAAAHAELDKRARASAAGLLANTGIYRTLQAAQQEATKATEVFVQGSNLVPNALAKSATANQAYKSSLLANTGIFKTIKEAQDETTKSTERFVAGSNLVPNVLAKGAAAQIAASAAFKQYSLASKETGSALAAFRASLGGLDSDTLRSIANAKGYSEVAGRLSLALGLSGEATRSFASKARDASGQLIQSTFAARAAALAQGEYEKRTKGSAEQTQKFSLEQRLAAQASNQAATSISRALVTTAATVGNQFLRLGGITSGFAGQTLGRELLTGLSNTARGFSRFGTAATEGGTAMQRLQRSAPQIGGALKAIEDEAEKTGSALTAAGLAAGPLTIGIAAVGVTALGTAAAFKTLVGAALEASKAFDIVALRAPKESLESLRALVFDLSAKTGIAFQDLADAEGRALLKVGGDADKSAQLLKVAADTALAAFTTPGQAVEALGDQLRNYGLEVEKVKNVSNILLIAQRTAREDFTAVANAIGPAVPIAKALGVELDDLASSISGVAADGLSLQQAGFGLRTVLSNLKDPTTSISKELRLLGVDTSDTAFRTKGLRGVMLDADAALRRTGTSLGAFFGEARKSGPIFSLLSGGGKAASEALAQMRSGADQTTDAIDRLNTPLREIRNALVELQNIVPKVGDAFAKQFSPAIVESIGLLKDLNFYFDQLKLKAPESAEAVAFLGHQFLLNIPIIGKFIEGAQLAGDGLEIFRKGLRALADDAGLLPRKAFGPINDLFGAVAIGATQAATAYAQLLAGLGKKADTGLAPGMFKAFADGAALAASAVPDLVHALDEIPAIAERASRGLNQVLRSSAIDRFVKEQLDKLKSTGNTVEGFRTLTQAIEDSGNAQEIAAGFADLYQRESEKTSKALLAQIGLFQVFSTALKTTGADVALLRDAFSRFRAEQDQVVAGQQLAEKANDGARQGLRSLAESYGLASDKSLQLQNELRDEYAAYAKRNALLDLAGKTTSAATKSVQALIDEEKLVAKAFEDTRTAVLEFQVAEKSTLENFEIQLKRVKDRADAFDALTVGLKSFGVNFAPLSADMRKFAADFEKFIVEPQRSGFSGGLQQDLKVFARDLADSFKVGQVAAQKLIANYQDIVQGTEDWKTSQHSTTQNLVAQVEKGRQLEQRIRALGPAFAEAADRIHDATAQFDKLVVSSRSFAGGFDAKIKEFANVAGDTFNVGGEEADKLITAYENVKSSLIAFKADHRTVLENLTFEVEKAHQLEAALRSAGNTDLADKIRQAADEFQRLEIKPRQEGFGGGFTEGIQKFVRETKDGFELGASAAQQFASNSVDAIQNFLLSLGKGKAGIKEFAIAVLQALEQMIARMLAFQIAGSIFGSLFPSFAGAGGGATNPFGFLAKGGKAEEGKPYVIGEKGPELFVPEENGQVVPYAKTMLALGSAPASAFGVAPGKASSRLTPRRADPVPGGSSDQSAPFEHVPAAAALTGGRGATSAPAGQPGILQAVLRFLSRAAAPAPRAPVAADAQRIRSAFESPTLAAGPTVDRGVDANLGLGAGPVRSSTTATPGGRGVVGSTGGFLARARDLFVPLVGGEKKGHTPRVAAFAAGGIQPGEMVAAHGHGWTSDAQHSTAAKHAVTAYEVGGVAPGLLSAIFKASDKAQASPADGAPRLKLVAERDAARIDVPASLGDAVLKQIRSGAPARGASAFATGPGALERQAGAVVAGQDRSARARRGAPGQDTVQGLARVAASIAIAVLPLAASVGPVRVSAATPSSATTAASSSPRTPRGQAIGQIAAALTRARSFAQGGIHPGAMISTQAAPAVSTWRPEADTTPGARWESTSSAGQQDPAILRSIRALTTPLARVVRALPNLRRGHGTASTRSDGFGVPSEIGMQLARTAPGAAARGSGQEQPTAAPSAIAGGITRFFRTAGASIAQLARAVPGGGAAGRPASGKPRAPATVQERARTARGIVSAIETAGAGVQQRVSREARTGGSAGRAGAAAARGEPRSRTDAARSSAGQSENLPAAIGGSIIQSIRGLARAARSDLAGATGSRQGGQDGDGSEFLGQAGTVFARWAGVARTLSAREFAMGGVATQPSLALFAERPGMAEAFVPLPGPNRGIPVEFKNSGRGMGGGGGPQVVHIHVGGITLVSQSIDPRGAAAVIIAQMPAIERALASTLEDGKSGVLTSAIRRIGR